MADRVVIRPGGPADVPAVLGLLDLAGEWLVAQGRTGQWGTQRQSTSPRRLEQSQVWGDSGALHLALLHDAASDARLGDPGPGDTALGDPGLGDGTRGGVPVGALVVGLPANFAPAPAEPDLYVNLLVTHRGYAGRGLGALLLGHARALARAAGIGLLRLDCYAGGDGKLVRYYEGQGFTATADLVFGEWRGKLLEQRLPGEPPPCPGGSGSSRTHELPGGGAARV